MRCVVGRICRLRRQEQKGCLLAVPWFVSCAKHIAPYDDMHIIHERNVKSLAYRWSTTHNSVTKFCGAVDRLEAMWPLRAVTMEIVSFASSCSTC